MTRTVHNDAELLMLPQTEIDALYRQSPPGETPKGDTRGTAIIAPGTVVSKPLALLFRLTTWQGKVFDAQRPILRNKLTPFGVRAIVAQVYNSASWVDGRPCIVLDYSKTSLVACLVRDEIREVAPGLFLGVVFLWKFKLLNFSLACATRVARNRRSMDPVG